MLDDNRNFRRNSSRSQSKPLGSNPQDIFSNFRKVLSGWIILCIGLMFAFASIPIYAFRYFLATVIVPRFFSGKIGKPVSAIGNLFAIEFLRNFPPRCAIVTNFVIEGTATPKEVRETIEECWINKKVPQDGDSNNSSEKPYFPELTQYVEHWLGFLFWKQDLDFDVTNHLVFHEIPKNGNDDSVSEKYVCTLMEELLNKPFPRKKSPWEIHMIRNYVNSELNKDEKQELTVFVFRFHHALADGFSILHAVVEGIFGTSLSEISLPSTDAVTITPEQTVGEALSDFLLASYDQVMNVFNDLDYISSLVYRPRTAWHVSDRKKKWKQLYTRSPIIPVERIKFIKDKHDVSFTGVLFSCISAGVAKSLNKKRRLNQNEEVESLATLIPLPLAGHPKTLENHVTGTVFDLPVKTDLNPVSRLMESECRLQAAKKTTIPILGVMFTKMIGSHFARVAATLLPNRVLSMGLSNFPGPRNEISWKGRRGLTGDFVAGAVNGDAGVGFMVLSYRDHMRIAATAEAAVMDKIELEEMVRNVCAEIDVLEKSAEII